MSLYAQSNSHSRESGNPASHSQRISRFLDSRFRENDGQSLLLGHPVWPVRRLRRLNAFPVKST